MKKKSFELRDALVVNEKTKFSLSYSVFFEGKKIVNQFSCFCIFKFLERIFLLENSFKEKNSQKKMPPKSKSNSSQSYDDDDDFSDLEDEPTVPQRSNSQNNNVQNRAADKDEKKSQGTASSHGSTVTEATIIVRKTSTLAVSSCKIGISQLLGVVRTRRHRRRCDLLANIHWRNHDQLCVLPIGSRSVDCWI